MSESDVASAFRAKATFMKNWKPASTPSNRDRLELYGLHKQAVSGDAPLSFSTSASVAEKAKYNIWRSKSGLGPADAMKLYLQESDRQIRVYGSVSSTPTPNNSSTASSSGSTEQNSNNNSNQDDTPRGLAAIPLLCAAAAESRPAYLRRLSQTPIEAAWWARQEPLVCSDLGGFSFSAWPEYIVIFMARLIEQWSLASSNKIVAALLWPLHNAFLSLWMLTIGLLTIFGGCLQILQILIWGARRTGISLNKVWADFDFLVDNIHGACEPHQALTCRLVGLSLLPATYALAILRQSVPSLTLASASLVVLLSMTWWYFCLVLPWLSFLMLGTACFGGGCFAVIEFAGI
jgi:acyl-CoA-binding protein